MTSTPKVLQRLINDLTLVMSRITFAKSLSMICGVLFLEEILGRAPTQILWYMEISPNSSLDFSSYFSSASGRNHGVYVCYN